MLGNAQPQINNQYNVVFEKWLQHARISFQKWYCHAALQWLRRRGPDLPNGMLQQLFRKRRVKVCHLGSARVHRASKDLVLGQGSRILLPKEVAASALTWKEASVGRLLIHPLHVLETKTQ